MQETNIPHEKAFLIYAIQTCLTTVCKYHQSRYLSATVYFILYIVDFTLVGKETIREHLFGLLQKNLFIIITGTVMTNK